MSKNTAKVPSRRRAGRNGRGRSAVWQIEPGGFWQSYDYDASLGKWLRRSTFAKSLAAALQIRDARIRHGELVEAGLVSPLLQPKLQIHDACGLFLTERRNNPKGITERHLEKARRVILLVANEASFGSVGDITEQRWSAAVAKLKGRREWANATCNYARAHWKAFTRWLHRTGMIPADPLVSLRPWSGAGFERRRRRALTDDEVRRLFEATLRGGEVQWIGADDRAMLYRIALATGLRLSELASLTGGDFHLDAPAHVRVDAAVTKNRKPVHQPITAELVGRLRNWLHGRQRKALLWPTLKGACNLIRPDLERAGIPLKDQDGRIADFHALRHTFCTNLSRAGVPPQRAMRLARHSSINLTMRFYTHIDHHDLVTDLEASVDEAACNKRAGPVEHADTPPTAKGA